MLVLEYKAKGNKIQYLAIEEAIKTTQFVRNKCLRYWMDASKSVNNLTNSTELNSQKDVGESPTSKVHA